MIKIVEGKTKLLVPEESLKADQPPKMPVFFNPKAKIKEWRRTIYHMTIS